MLNLLTSLLPLFSGVLDKVIPDPKAREEAKLKLIQEAQSGKLQEVEKQLKHSPKILGHLEQDLHFYM